MMSKMLSVADRFFLLAMLLVAVFILRIVSSLWEVG